MITFTPEEVAHQTLLHLMGYTINPEKEDAALADSSLIRRFVPRAIGTLFKLKGGDPEGNRPSIPVEAELLRITTLVRTKIRQSRLPIAHNGWIPDETHENWDDLMNHIPESSTETSRPLLGVDTSLSDQLKAIGSQLRKFARGTPEFELFILVEKIGVTLFCSDSDLLTSLESLSGELLDLQEKFKGLPAEFQFFLGSISNLLYRQTRRLESELR